MVTKTDRKPGQAADFRQIRAKDGPAHHAAKPGQIGLRKWVRKLRRRRWTWRAIGAELGIDEKTARFYGSRFKTWDAWNAARAARASVKRKDSAGCIMEMAQEPQSSAVSGESD